MVGWLQGLRAGRVMIRRVRAEPAAHCLAFASSVITLLPIHSDPMSPSFELQGTTTRIGGYPSSPTLLSNQII
jgi:hypothetical protein